MEEQEDVEFVFPHKCIKNTSTKGTVLTEHLLNISGSLWTPKKNKKTTLTTRQDKRKEWGIKKDQQP